MTPSKRQRISTSPPTSKSTDDPFSSDAPSEALNEVVALLLSRSLYSTTFPASQTTPKIKNDEKKLQSLFDDHVFRTNVILSPRTAVSIYRDSFVDDDSEPPSSHPRSFLQLLFGIHPNQRTIERDFFSVKESYIFTLLCDRLRFLSPTDDDTLKCIEAAQKSMQPLQPSNSDAIKKIFSTLIAAICKATR